MNTNTENDENQTKKISTIEEQQLQQERIKKKIEGYSVNELIGLALSDNSMSGTAKIILEERKHSLTKKELFSLAGVFIWAMEMLEEKFKDNLTKEELLGLRRKKLFRVGEYGMWEAKYCPWIGGMLEKYKEDLTEEELLKLEESCPWAKEILLEKFKEDFDSDNFSKKQDIPLKKILQYWESKNNKLIRQFLKNLDKENIGTIMEKFSSPLKKEEEEVFAYIKLCHFSKDMSIKDFLDLNKSQQKLQPQLVEVLKKRHFTQGELDEWLTHYAKGDDSVKELVMTVIMTHKKQK